MWQRGQFKQFLEIHSSSILISNLLFDILFSSEALENQSQSQSFFSYPISIGKPKSAQFLIGYEGGEGREATFAINWKTNSILAT